jgi:hypothetical protein
MNGNDPPYAPTFFSLRLWWHLWHSTWPCTQPTRPFFLSTQPFSINLISLHATTSTTNFSHTLPGLLLSPSTSPLCLTSQKTTAPQNNPLEKKKVRLYTVCPPFVYGLILVPHQQATEFLLFDDSPAFV